MILLFGLDLILIVTFAYLFVALCRLPALAASLAGLLVTAYGTILFAALIVAEIGFLNNAYAHLVAHLVMTTLVLWLWNRARRPTIGLSPLKTALSSQAIRTQPELTLLLLGVGLLYSLSLYLMLALPYNSHDSMAYHLARIGYWLQYNSLRPYPAYEILQTTFPVNSSLAMLWTIIFWGSDQLAGLFQWLAVLGSGITIYGLARLIGGSRPQALFAGLIWTTLPVVVLQSSTTLNDMVAAFLAITTTYFLFLGLRHNSFGALLLSGLSLGLGIGTKGTIFMFLPSLSLVALFFLVRYRLKYLPRLIVWGGACTIGVLLLGSYIYVINFLTYTNTLGPHAAGGTATVADPTVETITTNMARYLYQLVDTTGLPYPVEDSIRPWQAQAGRQIFSALNLNENLPEATRLPPTAFTFDGSNPQIINASEFGPARWRSHEVLAWFGPLGFLLFAPAILYHAVTAPFKGQIDRWLLAMMSITFFVVISYLMRWTPYRGRFMAMAIGVAAPLLIVYFRRGAFWGVLRWGIILLALVVSSRSVAFNLAKPLLGPVTIWDVDYAEQRSFYGGPTDFVRAVEDYIPLDTTVGIIGRHLWEYPLFGPDFSRSVLPIYPFPEEVDGEKLEQQNVDYLIINNPSGRSTPRLPENYVLLAADDPWQILVRQEKLPEWFSWALDRQDHQSVRTSALLTIDPLLSETVAAEVQLSAGQEIEKLGSQSVLWLGLGEGQGLKGTIRSTQERLVELVFDVLPGPVPADRLRAIELTVRNTAGLKAESRQFDQAAMLTFEVVLQTGANEFYFKLHDQATVLAHSETVSRPRLVLLRHLSIKPIIDKNQANVGPIGDPLAIVDSPLMGTVGFDPKARIPWPIEIDQDGSFLWLGQGEAAGIAGTIWSDAVRSVWLEFEVSPGPGREDSQRTVQLVNRSEGQITRQDRTFDGPTVLTFPVQLQPGRNDFQFTVLDEATIAVQPNNDTRPLLVRLGQITIKGRSN